MAIRANALSQWLPGFDPGIPDCPDLLTDRHVTSTACPSPPWCAEPIPLAFATCGSEEELLQSGTVTNWRTSAIATTNAAPRVLWSQLKDGDLPDLRGSVSKFEANLAAIDLL